MSGENSKNPSAPELFSELLKVMETLRGPKGCPWDKKQDHQSLIPCLLEESYELIDALDRSESQAMQEELGDVLLQVVFHSQIAQEEKKFSMAEVLRTLTDKLIRRHPHVFGDASVEHPEEALQNWERIKAKEKAPNQSILSGVPPELPALLRAYRIGAKASRVGFDWENLAGVLQKVQEELAEFNEELAERDTQGLEEEFGDLLFALAQTARFLHFNPEEALRKSTQKFQRRFEWMERKLKEGSRELGEISLGEWEELWTQAKSSTDSVKKL